MTLGFFALGGLDLRRALVPNAAAPALAGSGADGPTKAAAATTADERRGWRAWIYAQQITRTTPRGLYTGFRGGPFAALPAVSATDAAATVAAPKGTGPAAERDHLHDLPHITNTYTALANLLMLGDDLAGVRRAATAASLRLLQDPATGAMVPYPGSREQDLRFVYCACVISTLLRDWRGLDVPRLVGRIARCRNPLDGAYGQVPGQESHGGSTFCAVAALVLIRRAARDGHDGAPSAAARDGAAPLLEALLAAPRLVDVPGMEETREWLLCRQVELPSAEGGGSSSSSGGDDDATPAAGFQGRINKVPDTCYAFWIGAAIALLDGTALTAPGRTRAFLRQTRSARLGGYSKSVGGYPDVLHAFMGLAGTALISGAADDGVADDGADAADGDVHGQPSPTLDGIDPALTLSARAAAHWRSLVFPPATA
ncbi:hypothetical protein CXG81DRAFT_23663 [Caulochytrium protostelioides]|uniref:Prenyltransferase alpha-alpha toroid domain-containing protein n=1 Tax=Caulochytrium protostelioides TaxID=1555241 RepID=A0A4P9XEV0_9FUNG|nr:hypothetical protein CXG81DRAFT_23663 [Caulochytrium protostelioides]|eukprot:RKP03691.1 hypothetical protein CXG81DRAFT_23663 [Caulochytrium protostelioides]